MDTIFTIFAGVTDKFGITKEWLDAAVVNIMMLLGIVKVKFPNIDGFAEESAVVGAAAAILAFGMFYATPMAAVVAIVAIWAATTLAVKTAGKTTAATYDFTKSKLNREPSKLTDKPEDK